MLIAALLLLIGMIGLYYGADWLVNGSSRIAVRLGVKPLVVGLTIVSFGTSAYRYGMGSADLALPRAQPGLLEEARTL